MKPSEFMTFLKRLRHCQDMWRKSQVQSDYTRMRQLERKLDRLLEAYEQPKLIGEERK